MKTKVCSDCKMAKPLSAFYKSVGKREGVQSVCKDCHDLRSKAWGKTPKGKAINKAAHRRNHIKRKFGIPESEYETIMFDLWNDQKGCCAICGTLGTSYGKQTKEDPTTLHLDHNHTNGQLRSLLCFPCNNAIGLLQDSPELCSKASDYLQQYLKN